MKLLFLTEFYPTTTAADVRGGVELRTFMVTQGLADQHDITVIAQREPSTPADSLVGKVRVLRPGPASQYRQGGGLLNRWRYMRAARRMSVTLNPDLIMAENFVGYTIALGLPATWQAKTILTYHDVWLGEWVKNVGLATGLVGEVLERMVLRRHWKHYVANSEVTKKELEQHGILAKNITVIYNGIDLQALEKIQPEQFNRPTIIAVARLVKYKRIDDLLRALIEVKKNIADAKLVVIGSGPQEKSLKKLAHELGISESVEWRGFVPNYNDVLAAIKGATVFSLPSAVEGFGLVTLEAMACGTPFVSSNIAPTREVTLDGQGGVLYGLGDLQALAKGLLEILSHSEIRHELSSPGIQRAQAFSWENSLKQLRGVL